MDIQKIIDWVMQEMSRRNIERYYVNDSRVVIMTVYQTERMAIEIHFHLTGEAWLRGNFDVLGSNMSIMLINANLRMCEQIIDEWKELWREHQS